MKWFKRQDKKELSPEAFTFFLLKHTADTVKATSQALKKHLNAEEQTKLTKIEGELFYFFVFALDYHWTTLSTFTKEEKRMFREAFYAHLENIVSQDTLQERLNAYAQIVIDTKGSPVMFLDFGTRLSEFCGMPGFTLLIMTPGQLFKEAAEPVLRLRSVRLKLS